MWVSRYICIVYRGLAIARLCVLSVESKRKGCSPQLPQCAAASPTARTAIRTAACCLLPAAMLHSLCCFLVGGHSFWQNDVWAACCSATRPTRWFARATGKGAQKAGKVRGWRYRSVEAVEPGAGAKWPSIGDGQVGGSAVCRSTMAKCLQRRCYGILVLWQHWAYRQTCKWACEGES